MTCKIMHDDHGKCQSSLPYQAILQMKELGVTHPARFFFVVFRLNELEGK
jgi:hypothetical protein